MKAGQVEDSIKRAWYCVNRFVRPIQFHGLESVYFPLFLEENPIVGFHETYATSASPSEVDCCATAFGISIISSSIRSLGSQAPSQERREVETIRKACDLIFEVRPPGGGWPSLIHLTKGLKVEKVEGTINDTFYCLSALLDVGFPTYQRSLIDKTITEQLDVLHDAVGWLMKNRVQKGWYYIETEFIRPEDQPNITPAVLPTSYVLSLLPRIRSALRRVNEEIKSRAEKDCETLTEKNNRLVAEIDRVYSAGIDWLRTSQSETDSGWGKTVGDKTKITDTLLACSALLTDDSNESAMSILKALRMLLKKGRKRLEALPDDDLYESYDQIWLIKADDKLEHMRRLVIHENAALAVLLQFLAQAHNKRYGKEGSSTGLVEYLTMVERIRFHRLIQQVAEDVLHSQAASGVHAGAFRGYRPSPLAYPIYTIYDSLQGLTEFIAFQRTTPPGLGRLLVPLFLLVSPIPLILIVGHWLSIDVLIQLFVGLLTEVLVGAYAFGLRAIFGSKGPSGK